ncbi:hypothetical protein M427DRAFT_52884 [Gonapodya prolifera JEL478]|uniref:Secreted protein n=1 Tax=Gonapodya prolifera (strain JEL478) TaxID=1344416 RepID=A0A139ASC8_GONPJ|nr:hypothetical protein M427DRAFT_52884 [Gonapodya prolifera JEL478]|eukprot:KXS19443.1 hypothetical protein M427DRAFT_52884 [Gonapodya prolifera JEL478]
MRVTLHTTLPSGSYFLLLLLLHPRLCPQRQFQREFGVFFFQHRALQRKNKPLQLCTRTSPRCSADAGPSARTRTPIGNWF